MKTTITSRKNTISRVCERIRLFNALQSLKLGKSSGQNKKTVRVPFNYFHAGCRPRLIVAFMIGLLFITGLSIHAQSAEPTRYNIGSIPDQTAWHNGTNQFRVHWEENPSVLFSLETYPEPLGLITFEPYQETNWLFQYVPATEDKTPFTVTLTATLGSQSTYQSYTTTPQPYLPPEQSVFGTEQHTQPSPIATYETKVFDRESLLDEDLNYQTGRVRDVRIIGETVVIEEGNSLYEAYFSADELTARKDIGTMEIFAETVIIRSPTRLKQTDVAITARELRFEGDGQLKTTPEEDTTLPETTSKNGVDGLPAGNVTLNIGSLYTETAGVKFDLTGGRGQPGGPGEHGANGWENPYHWSKVTVSDSGSSTTYTAPSGSYIIYYDYQSILHSEKGDKTWPGDGTDAKPSGKPGEGGSGGDMILNYDTSGWESLAGGAAGSATYPSTSPTSYYKGGDAGFPQNAVTVHFYYSWFVVKHDTPVTHTSTVGEDAKVQKANSGSAGTANSVAGPQYAWVNPLVLRKIIDHAKDDHLGNRMGQAEARLKDYVQVLEDYYADEASWAQLDETTQFELEQMYDEMQITLQQIANGLDYFGNPAGWVPMLSFEVNQAMFANEIERAINMLYLAYWINNKADSEEQKVDALTAAREQTRQELAQAIPDYDAAVVRLPVLNNKAISLDNMIVETQLQLQAKEQELMEELREPSWLTGVRLGLKMSAMICQMVPIYQPALGAAGEGLRLVSDIDPDKPWDTILGGVGLADTYLDSGFDAASQQQKTAKDGIDPNLVESRNLDYLGAMRTASAGLSAGIADMSGFLAEQQSPSPEMLAELEQLKSLSPECKELVEKIEGFHQEKRQFADELISTMQQIASLSDLIARDMLAIDGMNRGIASGVIVLDERATSYLGDMERRAYDRLLKYHYYMAKAYEYRLLRPYTEPLNLEGLIEKFKEIADLNNDHIISTDQFETFKGVFEEKLALVAETIFDEYNANRPELSVPIRFSLTSDEIATLNNGETVSLNMMNEGWFFSDEENVRIVDLHIYSIETETEGGGYGNPAYLDVNIAHSGLSKTKKDGAVYQFMHYNRQTDNPITWGGRFDPVDDEINPKQPSAASDSLLRSLLSTAAQTDMLLYSRPSAWADLNISRKFLNIGGQAINIKSLRLEMQYDFTPRNETLGRKDLEVLVTTVLPDELGIPEENESNIMPYFVVATTNDSSRPDFNGRQDGKGRILRIFTQSDQPVRITAQKEYGMLGFNKWTMRGGADIPGGPYTNPTIELVPQADQWICAQYVPLTELPMVLYQPELLDGAVNLFWDGGTRTSLQKSDSLIDPAWQDVPASEGRSDMGMPTTDNAGYFRLIRR